MFIDRLIDLIERTINFSFSKRAARRVSLLLRLLVVFAFTFVIVRLAPTMADELTPNPENEVSAPVAPEPAPSESSSASPEPEVTPTPVAIPSEEPVAPVPTATPSPSTSASPPTPSVLANQNMRLRVPASLLVDPRARTASVSELFVAGPQNLLVCISSGSTLSDVYLKNMVDSDFGTQTLVAGDRSANVRVTGNAEQVLAILNSAQGIRVTAPLSTIANQSVYFRFVATSAPTLDAALCAKGSPANTRTLTFRELGLQIEMKKGDVILKQ